MGYQIYDEDDQQCELIQILQKHSDRKLRQLTGNAMHLRAVGTCIMFILAGTERI